MGHKQDDEALQRALVAMQEAAIEAGTRAVVVLEGRDAAGKDGTIKALIRHMSTRATRVVALPKPNEREATQWFLQRYVAHLPAAGEIVIFNRSWYNRSGVEVVNGFSTAAEQAQFLRDAPDFERMLVESGIVLVKLWLDIDRDEQAKRLEKRRSDPLKSLKVSALDAVAQDRWDAYSEARDVMLERTHTPSAPWQCVRADHKNRAHRAVIRHVLHRLAPADTGCDVPPADPDVLFPFDPSALADGRLAR